jgi:hypothetical protein
MSSDNLALSISDTSAATTPSEWVKAFDRLGGARELDLKTKALCYLSALAGPAPVFDVESSANDHSWTDGISKP